MTIFKTQQITVCTVAQVLTDEYGNQSATAKRLGVTRSTLSKWITSNDYKSILCSVTTNIEGTQTVKIINK